MIKFFQGAIFAISVIAGSVLTHAAEPSSTSTNTTPTNAAQTKEGQTTQAAQGAVVAEKSSEEKKPFVVAEYVVDEAAPNLQLVALTTQEPLNVKDLKDQANVILVWSTQCKHCTQQLQDVLTLQKDPAFKNVRFIFTSPEKPEIVAEFLKTQNIDVASFFTHTKEEAKNVNFSKATVIDKGGKVRLKLKDNADWKNSDLKKMITEIAQ